MGLAAFPDGREALKRDPSWNDIMMAQLKKKLGRVPTEAERNNPDKEVETDVIMELLRLRHAKQAEQLAVAEYKDSKGRETYHLIEDPELRKAFGAVIGQIAHSHWWSIDEVRQKFATLKPLYPPASMNCPSDWTVDRLKLACLLRTADAIHLDGRRAPGFLRALRKPEGYADLHWTFQQNVNVAGREQGQERVIFTSGYEFTVEEASAWWVGYELLQTADKELRQVDILFQDLERKYRFAARGVAGVEEPERLRQHIPTHDWVPVDARIQVSNVAALVRNLGGEQLYGENRTVPLRELIQNASDAVRARRLLEKHPENWGDVTVRMGEDEHGHWIEVDDMGVGMSTYVLTGPFLDFGQSFWGTPKMHEDLPGLQGTGFTSTGKYGIGFFSVFMWGERVRVITRRYEAARNDTNILEFQKGPASRPILRKADSAEQRSDGGTTVRVWLKRSPVSEGGLLRRENFHKSNNPLTLEQLCSWLCPAIDVNLYTQEGNKTKTLVIQSNDWITMDGKALLERIVLDWEEDDDIDDEDSTEDSDANPVGINRERLAQSLREIKDEIGSVIGRICIYPYRREYFEGPQTGVITVGGFRSSSFGGIAGIIQGFMETASRREAIPMLSSNELKNWATEQANIVKEFLPSHKCEVSCAGMIRACGGSTGELSIAFGKQGWVDMNDIYQIASAHEEILIVHDISYSLSKEYGRHIENLNPNVLVISLSIPGMWENMEVNIDNPWTQDDDLDEHLFHSRSLLGVVIEAATNAWQTNVSQVLKASDIRNHRIKRVVGTVEDAEIEMNVYIIRRPMA